MIYTKYFGADVAGLVFVDTSHPDQISRFKALEALESNSARSNRQSESNWSAFVDKSGAALNWTGIVRLVAAMDEDGDKTDSNDQAVEAYASTSLGPFLKESDAFEQTLNEAGTFRHLGDRPIVVLAAVPPVPKQELSKIDKAARENGAWMKEDQAKWSSQSRYQLVQDTSHYIQSDQPAVVIDAVRSVISKVREK
jgi:pimeloyl-ACP methyl ester carboxylesterase